MPIFVGMQDKSVSGVGCRSPPTNLNFQKEIQIGGTHYGLQQSQRRKEKMRPGDHLAGRIPAVAPRLENMKTRCR